jgi:hypothetical protein
LCEYTQLLVLLLLLLVVHVKGCLEAHESVAGHTVADLVSAAELIPEQPGATKGGRSSKLSTGKSTAKGKAIKGKFGPDHAPTTREGRGRIGEAPSVPAQVPVLLFADTAGCGFEETAEDEGDSKYNEGEAKVITEAA